MERNNLLVRKIIIMGILSIFSFGLGGCFSEQIPTKNDIVGVWKSQYGETLTINNDSSFIADNLKTESLYRKASKEKINGQGNWEIVKKKDVWILHLSFSIYVKDGIKNDRGQGFPLYIRGDGFLGNKLPWRIHSWDEDDFDFSVFKKVE